MEASISQALPVLMMQNYYPVLNLQILPDTFFRFKLKKHQKQTASTIWVSGKQYPLRKKNPFN
ncbi:hypothetical protein [Adhaeribacter soli]|uniref:Uncharacterized protein n=1 Tax=Adhaeribacter soli TaxID=2607655 RepID=A0A5N1IIB7_9BACT|nr:hypothetical protein [Adhaeribacter soli]KAA9325148.1 hypothetical protein F0P94_18105 [Adhaeribacter soli]